MILAFNLYILPFVNLQISICLIQNAMHWAAKHGKPDVIKMLQKYQVDPNLKSHCGYTPLHLAAMAGNEECIDVLVNLCSELNIFVTKPISLSKSIKSDRCTLFKEENYLALSVSTN